jgi:Tfp pilus assembly protein PilF
MFLKWAAAALVTLGLGAQVPGSAVMADPLDPPEELQTFARRATHNIQGSAPKLQALLEAFFRSPESGGLGISYDNSRTRTIREVWQDRQANCLGLTSLYVAACRAIGVEVHYAEPVNTSHWKRSGDVIRYERHIVAMALLPPSEDLVADFLPKLQHRQGRYVVQFLGEARVRALWASNRAVECMEAGDLATAEQFAKQALTLDPSCSTGWNTLGVLRGFQNDRATAERCYRKALSLDPSDGTAVGNLEVLLRGDGRWEEAMQYRRLGLELRKRDPYFQAFLATESLGEGRHDEALKHIRSAIKLQPYDPDFHLIEARIRLELGKLEDAERSLELARKWASPKDRERFDSKLAALRQLPG